MALPPTQSKTLGKLVGLLEPQFPHLASAGLIEACELPCCGSAHKPPLEGASHPQTRREGP